MTQIELSSNDNSTVELDSLLDTGTSGVVDDLDELNQLLAESMSAKEDARKVKEARKALASKGTLESEREELKRLVAQWELKREWTPVANTIMFDVQHCTNCGTQHKHFTGLFQRQEHKVSKITRWIRSVEDSALPKEVKESTAYAGICSGCCSNLGWR